MSKLKRKTDKDIFEFYLFEIPNVKKKYDYASSRRYSPDFESLSPSEQRKLIFDLNDAHSNYVAFCRVFTDFVLEHADKIKFE